MERLLIVALLAANFGIFLFLCHLVLLVKRTLIHGGRQLELEERAERLQRALEEMTSRLDDIGAAAAERLTERSRELVALAESCERTVRGAQEVLASLTEACEHAQSALDAVQTEVSRSAAPAKGEEPPVEAGADAPDAEARGALGTFVRRNARAIALAREGLSKEQIAAKLGMSVGEVEVVLGVTQGLNRTPEGGEGAGGGP